MTGVLQGCLLVMGITFEWRAQRKRPAKDGDVDGNGNEHADEVDGGLNGHANGEQDDERTALLGNGR